jgi:hypothetical protein
MLSNNENNELYMSFFKENISKKDLEGMCNFLRENRQKIIFYYELTIFDQVFSWIVIRKMCLGKS